MWSVAGLIAAFGITILATIKSRRGGGYYDSDIYGMTAAVHRRYALVSASFGLLFLACAAFSQQRVTTWIFAAFTLFALFYLTSFLRGAHEDDDSD